jgi:hypothetical protein
MEQTRTPNSFPTNISKLVTAWEPYVHSTTKDGLTFIVAPFRIPTEKERLEGMTIDVYVGRDNCCSRVGGTFTGKKDGAYITFSYQGRHHEIYIGEATVMLQKEGRLPERLLRYAGTQER